MVEISQGRGCFPDFLETLVGKKLLFKVKMHRDEVNLFDGSFKVKRVCIDEYIIAMFELNGSNYAPLKANSKLLC